MKVKDRLHLLRFRINSSKFLPGDIARVAIALAVAYRASDDDIFSYEEIKAIIKDILGKRVKVDDVIYRLKRHRLLGECNEGFFGTRAMALNF